MEHEYLAKGLTETALTTLRVVLNKNFLQCGPHIRSIHKRLHQYTSALLTAYMIQSHVCGQDNRMGDALGTKLRK